MEDRRLVGSVDSISRNSTCSSALLQRSNVETTRSVPAEVEFHSRRVGKASSALSATHETAHHYNLEAPLLALLIGLIIGNAVRMPKWMDAGFRVEYYIKTGIVLLGATLPFMLIVYAGPVAFAQATTIAVSTFVTIYFVGTRLLNLDKRFAAVLGAGGAVCGVSASIAMAAAVRAKKEHVAMGITCVVVWAIVMIFVIPYVGWALNLHPGIVGAWVGTSEFADAAGFAAAMQYGLMYQAKYGFGADIAVWAFTLMKVIGRDMWIGLWAFVMAIIATTKWEVAERGQKPSAMEIWWRFPKFVLGFFAASVVMTLITAGVPLKVYLHQMKPLLIGPIKTMRTSQRRVKSRGLHSHREQSSTSCSDS